MYRGKDEARPTDVAATMWPVVQLADNACYYWKGHVLALDNWYTSIEVIKYCIQDPLNIEVVGTVKTNRTGLHKRALFPATGANKRARGTIEVHRRLIDPEQDVYVYQTSWMDSKPVHLLSTFGGGLYTTVARNAVNENCAYQQIQVPRPSIIATYNATMGGTDKFDQLEQYYDDRHRTLHWQMRIILHFLRAAVINAKILFESEFPTHRRLTLVSFIRHIIKEWSEDIDLPDDIDDDEGDDGSDSSEEGPSQVKRRFANKTKPWWKRHFKERNYFNGVHLPIHCEPSEERGPRGKVGKDNRRNCKVCGKKSTFLCDHCGVHLCISHDENSAHGSCFHVFHCYEEF
jgi:hypothetical protein